MEKILLSQFTGAELRKLFREELILFNSEQANKQQATTNQKTVFKFKEALEYLGISKDHGYKLTSKGQIPHSKRGKYLYFEKSELDKWLLSNKVKDASQLKQEAEEYLKNKGVKHGR